MRFKGQVQNGKLILDDRTLFMKAMKKLNGNVVIDISEGRGPRSLQQNSYYWGVVIEILADEFGYQTKEEKEYLHNVLMDKFIEDDTYELKMGEEVVSGKTRKTSSSLNTKQFEAYLANIRRWASQEYGVFIPEPNENYDYLLDN